MDKHEHKFEYPFSTCRICGTLLEVGDYTVARITGNWKVMEEQKQSRPVDSGQPRSINAVHAMGVAPPGAPDATSIRHPGHSGSSVE